MDVCIHVFKCVSMNACASGMCLCMYVLLEMRVRVYVLMDICSDDGCAFE